MSTDPQDDDDINANLTPSRPSKFLYIIAAVAVLALVVYIIVN